MDNQERNHCFQLSYYSCIEAECFFQWFGVTCGLIQSRSREVEKSRSREVEKSRSREVERSRGLEVLRSRGREVYGSFIVCFIVCFIFSVSSVFSVGNSFGAIDILAAMEFLLTQRKAELYLTKRKRVKEEKRASTAPPNSTFYILHSTFYILHSTFY